MIVINRIATLVVGDRKKTIRFFKIQGFLHRSSRQSSTHAPLKLYSCMIEVARLYWPQFVSAARNPGLSLCPTRQRDLRKDADCATCCAGVGLLGNSWTAKRVPDGDAPGLSRILKNGPALAGMYFYEELWWSHCQTNMAIFFWKHDWATSWVLPPCTSCSWYFRNTNGGALYKLSGSG